MRPGRSPREFAPRLFLAYLDVDALPDALDDVPGWSARRPRRCASRAEDFFTGTGRPLGDEEIAKENGRLNCALAVSWGS